MVMGNGLTDGIEASSFFLKCTQGPEVAFILILPLWTICAAAYRTHVSVALASGCGDKEGTAEDVHRIHNYTFSQVTHPKTI